jgi:hypothetical protein
MPLAPLRAFSLSGVRISSDGVRLTPCGALVFPFVRSFTPHSAPAKTQVSGELGRNAEAGLSLALTANPEADLRLQVRQMTNTTDAHCRLISATKIFNTQYNVLIFP